MAAGENNCTAFQFRDMLAADAVDYAQPSVTKVGGVTEFLKVATLADAAGVTLMPHSPYFGPGFLATLHLTAARGQPGAHGRALSHGPRGEPLRRADRSGERRLRGARRSRASAAIPIPT